MVKVVLVTPIGVKMKSFIIMKHEFQVNIMFLKTISDYFI